MKKKIACLTLLTAVLVAECMGGKGITAKAATTETTVENQTEFVKDYTEEHYGVGQGKYSADGRDNVTKYSFRTEAEIPYYVGREDKKATNFLKKNKHDAVLYLGMPLFLTTAMDNLNTTNALLSDAENEELKLAMGETDNTHDLTIALGKASTALSYTVAVRDKILEAYKELMQIQI